MLFVPVDASEAGKSPPEVVINNGSVLCVVVARGNHKYHVSFTPQEARRHFIQLKFKGQNLPSKTPPLLFGSGGRLFVVSRLVVLDIVCGVKVVVLEIVYGVKDSRLVVLEIVCGVKVGSVRDCLWCQGW